MATRVYVPRETAAVSVGADEVAVAIARQAKEQGVAIELVRNGSWGASWLEPLVEVAVDDKRIAYGNVGADDVPGMFAAGFLDGGQHERRLGPVDEIPYLINQERWTFWRCGLVAPLDIDDFRAHQGFQAFGKAVELGPQGVIDAVRESGLRGRGGAGFPTAVKLGTARSHDIDLLLINGVECEPYISCDDVLMRERAKQTISGARILMDALQVDTCQIAVESDKPEAVKRVEEAMNEIADERISIRKITRV